MSIARIAKFKSVFLVLVMLTFSVAMLGGQVIGVKPPSPPGKPPINVEQPVLEISKKMIDGKKRVPIETRVYWTLKIEVEYEDLTDLTDAIVRDGLPPELDLISTSVSKGTVETWANDRGTTQIRWTIGTMEPRDKEWLEMEIATGVKGGKQEFQKTGTHKLNRGASVKGIHEATKTSITAGPTDPITVKAYKPKE